MAGGPITTYGVVDKFSLGSDSSTFLVGHVVTKWFRVSDKAAKVLGNRDNLVGKKAELMASGTLFSNGKTDVKFSVFNKLGEGVTIIDQVDIPSSGGQFASTTVRGIIKVLPDRSLSGLPDA